MTEKIIGYLLIAGGILVMIFSSFDVYLIFTKQKEPIKLFSFKGVGIDTGKLLPADLPPELSKQLQTNQLGQNQVELISPDILNDTSNIFAHIIMMGFILNLGYKLASLGTKLVRPIQVKLKTTDQTVNS